MSDAWQADAHELRRCIYSHLGSLEAICDTMPVCPEGLALRACIEGGAPEMLAILDRVTGDVAEPPKSWNRGYQVVILMAREEATGQRDPAAWKQDPDEFMAALYLTRGIA
jgi:hypothetical protein